MSGTSFSDRKWPRAEIKFPEVGTYYFGDSTGLGIGHVRVEASEDGFVATRREDPERGLVTEMEKVVEAKDVGGGNLEVTEHTKMSVYEAGPAPQVAHALAIKFSYTTLVCVHGLLFIAASHPSTITTTTNTT